MDHEELQSLLGAYALDAVELEEALEIEAHLTTCPKCRAELEAHREMASLLGNSSVAAPDSVWSQIEEQISGQAPPGGWDAVLHQIGETPRTTRGRLRHNNLISAGVAAAAIVIALLGLQVANLSGQVNHDQRNSPSQAIATAVSTALSSSHRTIVLTSSDHQKSATVALLPNGQAYWVTSNLPKLADGKTYQLWGLASGRPISLGLIGANPNNYFVFRVEQAIGALALTVEPEGGTPAPTSPVVMSAMLTI